MSSLLFSAQYNKATDTLGDVATSWVGRPRSGNEQVFALFVGTYASVGETRWYVYGTAHDAIAIDYDKLPEVVRMAYLLIQ